MTRVVHREAIALNYKYLTQEETEFLEYRKLIELRGLRVDNVLEIGYVITMDSKNPPNWRRVAPEELRAILKDYHSKRVYTVVIYHQRKLRSHQSAPTTQYDRANPGEI